LKRVLAYLFNALGYYNASDSGAVLKSPCPDFNNPLRHNNIHRRAMVLHQHPAANLKIPAGRVDDDILRLNGRVVVVDGFFNDKRGAAVFADGGILG